MISTTNRPPPPVRSQSRQKPSRSLHRVVFSADALDGASRFVVLIMGEANGALVKKAAPPVR